MQPKKLTQLEILHRQKVDLQNRLDELTEKIENNAKYLQQNFVPLVRDSVIKSAVSKLPSQALSLTGSFIQKEKKTVIHDLFLRKIAQGIVIGTAEIAPFFLKGKKGAIVSFLLKQVVRWVRI